MTKILRNISKLLPLIALPFFVWAENPVANSEAVVTSGNARFTVLTPEMIRIEYSEKGVFEDRATFAIQNRELEVPTFTTTEDDTYLYIETEKLSLKYRKGTHPRTLPQSDKNLSISFSHNGEIVKWYPGKPDPQNLKGTCRTLDDSNGENKRAELEDGLISRSGWAIIDDSWSSARADGSRSFALEDNEEMGYQWWSARKDPYAMDTYFMGYGFEYKKALADFVKIAGRIPLPPKYVFGYWYSRYSSYKTADLLQIMSDLSNNGFPQDVMIIDKDWHWNGNGNDGSWDRGGWTGWSWNTHLIPNPEYLLKALHLNNLRVALNLHPADGINKKESPEYFEAMKTELKGNYVNGDNIEWNLDFTDFTKSFFKNIIRDHEREGVDFWWIDWQQKIVSSKTPGLGNTFWINHVFFNEMQANRTDRRPVIFHRWGGLGSHRYQIGFSGDSYINFATMAFQPYFTATASNVGYAFWGHDLGGHHFTDEKIVNDPEMMLRWMQFGVFSPILRTHASNDQRIERRLWKFNNAPLLRDAVKLRYALFPYIYTMARKTYDEGLGICRPLYYEYPQKEEAYKYEGEYFFGDNILVAPITEPAADGKTSYKEIWFPKGKWWSVATNEYIEGPCVMTMEFGASDIPYFYRAGAMIPLNPESVNRVVNSPDEMILDIVAGQSRTSSLYEDEGDNNDYATEYATTNFVHSVDGRVETYTIEPRTGVQADLPESRSWVMNILNAGTPEEVTINGIAATDDQWAYEAETRHLTVNVPETDCSNRIDVVVTYDKQIDGIGAATVSNSKLSYNTTTQTLVANLGKNCKKVSLSIVSVAGVEIFSKTYTDVSTLTENLAELAPAMYICRVKADNEQLTTKICK